MENQKNTKEIIITLGANPDRKNKENIKCTLDAAIHHLNKAKNKIEKALLTLEKFDDHLEKIIDEKNTKTKILYTDNITEKIWKIEKQIKILGTH